MFLIKSRKQSDNFRCLRSQDHVYTEGARMHHVLCRVFLLLFLAEIQRSFEEELMANPNMKIKQICDYFCDTYGQITQEEVKDNTDMLTIAC